MKKLAIIVSFIVAMLAFTAFLVILDLGVPQKQPATQNERPAVEATSADVADAQASASADDSSSVSEDAATEDDSSSSNETVDMYLGSTRHMDDGGDISVVIIKDKETGCSYISTVYSRNAEQGSYNDSPIATASSMTTLRRPVPCKK